MLAVHDIRAGDSLYTLAKRYYGEHAGWRWIAQANGLDFAPSRALTDLAAISRTLTKVQIPERPPDG